MDVRPRKSCAQRLLGLVCFLLKFCNRLSSSNPAEKLARGGPTMRFNTSLRAMFVMALGICVGGTVVLAQENLGKIVGTVLDPSGAAVPGAEIIATNSASGVATTT